MSVIISETYFSPEIFRGFLRISNLTVIPVLFFLEKSGCPYSYPDRFPLFDVENRPFLETEKCTMGLVHPALALP